MDRRFHCKVVPSTWLEHNGRRLDCGPYLSGAVEAKEILRRHSTVPLLELTASTNGGIFNGPRFPRIYVNDPTNGVPFLGSTDILNGDLSYVPLLSARQIKEDPSLVVDKQWSLITCSGTVGRMAYSRSDMKGMAGSQHFMRVAPDQAKIRPGYIYAYLSGRFGIPLIVSGTYGAVIQHIEPQHIADLPVPRLSDIEEQAHDLVQRAADLLDIYQHKVRQATSAYFESVGLCDLTAAEWHSWGADLGFSVAADAKSLRALNFNPRFKRVCDQIRSSSSWKQLGELCVPGTLKRGERFTRVDADPEFSYRLVGQKELFWLRPEGRWVAKRSVPTGALVEDGCVLVAAQGTLGESELYCRAEFATGRALRNAYSEHILRVLADESVIQRGALFAFMRSETAFRMLRSIAVGSKLQDHHYAFLPELPVPYPPQDVRQRCNQLIVDAHRAREEAVELEDQARSLVEEAIEGGGRDGQGSH